MQSGGEHSTEYAHLPDELLEGIIKDVSSTVSQAISLVHIDENTIEAGRNELLDQNLIQTIDDDGDSTSDIIAVDGGYALQRLTDVDLVLVQAAGVEGLGPESSTEWGEDRGQHLSWQSTLTHNPANTALARGIMTLMELSVLAKSNHHIKLLDGSHLSMVIALSMLFSSGSRGADRHTIRALQDYIDKFYSGDINEIYRTVTNIISNDTILASTKYSSSRVAIDTFLSHLDIKLGDKAFFGYILKGGEYLSPQPIGLHTDDDQAWSTAHINLNLNLPGVDKDEFNWLINEAIAPIKVRDINSYQKDSNLCYTYFRPFDEGPVYRLEIKQSLAENKQRLEKTLRSIKDQVVYPEIIEPYPQYLADIVAKSVSKGMELIKEAVVIEDGVGSSPSDSIQILRGYRT